MNHILVLKDPVGMICSSSDIMPKIKRVKMDYSQENFLVFFLNTKNQLITSKIMFKGGLNACSIDPRTIFRTALKVNANSIIIAHNHPSGCLDPSYEDRQVYEKLKEAGKIIDIRVIDSITFNKTSYYSMN